MSYAIVAGSRTPRHVIKLVNSVVIVVVALLLIVDPSATGEASRQRRAALEFTDDRQRELVDSLRDYDISFPAKVTSSGEHLSHSVEHRVTSSTNQRRRRSAESTDRDQVHYRVAVAGTPLHLALQVNHKLFAPGLVIERRQSGYRNLSDSSRLQSLVDKDRCHFYGEVKGQPGSTVALSACNGLHGFIHTGQEQYFIEPVRGRMNSTTDSGAATVGHPHLIYKRSALPPGHDLLSIPLDHNESQEERHGTCGVTSEADSSNHAGEREEQLPSPSSKTKSTTEKRHGKRLKRSVSLERNVETLVVVDQSMVIYYKNEDIETYVLTIMNMVSTMYHDSTIGNAINIVLVRIIFLEQEEVGLKIGHHADNTLASFCKWQTSINPRDEIHANHHDVAVLLTRVNICSRSNEPCSTLGLSQVSGMCQPHRSCNINEDTGLALAFTVAHEIGHNFGMQHDSVENGCEPKIGESRHVMSPQMTAEASPLIWSNCSRKAVTAFLDRDWGYCLNDEPAEHQFNFPVLPPGVMYDIDHQCRLQYGPEAEFCDGIDDPCTTVWCRVEKKCLTRLEAAAAGTLCRTDEHGAQHWCFSGQCTEIFEKPLAIDGQWSEWAPWSECSRSCGAGVQNSERHCANPPPTHGGRYCLGERKRFKICEVNRTCPEGAPSFREHQCAEFNSIPYKGQRYEYEPVNTPATPCQLHCRPKGRLFSVMLKDVVNDGTPCRRGRRDMCIGGRCRVVGCDWKIESDAVEDQCGVCHGDGSTCTTVKQSFDKAIGAGYVEATVIPEGARNIRVEEVAEANNYLAIRNDKGQYYLNGHWYIQWSGDYEVAGTVIRYRREGNKESLDASGPIKEPLHVMLLFQSQNPGVKLEYTVPIENVTDRRRPEFHWKYIDWTHCTVSCGGGTQSSRVVCVEKETGNIDDSYCSAMVKPDDMHMTCNEHQCPARWWTGPWQHCSVSCGNQGTRKRTVLCVRQLGPDEQIALEDRDCEALHKPDDVSPCRHKDPCPVQQQAVWKTGPWNTHVCQSEPCGMQTRPVLCTDPMGKCDPAVMPLVERRCSNVTCGTWTLSNWSQCSRSCGGGFQQRNITCIGGLACPLDDQPPVDRQCNEFPCVPTTWSTVMSSVPAWVTSASDRRGSSSPLNEPAMVRSTTPVSINATSETENATLVPSSSSVSFFPGESTFAAGSGIPTTVSTLLNTTSEIRPLQTNYRWMALFWGECSRPCGGGIKHRSVLCIDVNTRETVSDQLCVQQKPPKENVCNAGSCIEWTTSDWQPCSATCDEGIQERMVVCQEPGPCDPEQKPLDRRACHSGSCLLWTTGPWDKCSQTCGGGVKRRQVRCENPVNGENTTGCDPLQQPSSIENCNTEQCEDTSDDTDSATVAPPREEAALLANDVPTQCVDTLSVDMCQVLLRMGRCRLEYIQRKCCRTCIVTRSREGLTHDNRAS